MMNDDDDKNLNLIKLEILLFHDFRFRLTKLG